MNPNNLSFGGLNWGNPGGQRRAAPSAAESCMRGSSKVSWGPKSRGPPKKVQSLSPNPHEMRP